ncbi:type IV pilus twitching motility protein PilT [candidate division TA06 bacterium]|uniref:Type IV pilus twitching motility protein PilT n=1 Tax=candidate division TA06 bacterium TaxID=2250710 RepID=A0A933I7I2_UNCT6|nr:type IV pilus twitching motility protein PilT [candidate division TA06 bacterium]
MEISQLLQHMAQQGASDLHLKVGSSPLLRIYGDLLPTQMPALTPDDIKRFVDSVLTPAQWQRFTQDLELDFAYTQPGTGRFRVNLFLQRSSLGLVFRLVPEKIPSLDELGFPAILKEIALRPRGLVLVTGPAGCGKSTTQASMLDHRNANDPCHIMTVEDPVEFIHTDKKAIVNQRELGRDTLTFADALKYVLRQDPDCILIGEMRDLETISLAITAAETGHLVLATLHTTDAVQTIDRIIDVFPLHQQEQIRMQVAVNFVAVISQILVKRADGRGRVAAHEIMTGTGAVRNLIREGKTYQLQSLIQTSVKQGMCTLNMSLASLFRRKLITLDEALSKSTDPENLQQIMRSQ